MLSEFDGKSQYNWAHGQRDVLQFCHNMTNIIYLEFIYLNRLCDWQALIFGSFMIDSMDKCGILSGVNDFEPCFCIWDCFHCSRHYPGETLNHRNHLQASFSHRKILLKK